MRAPAAFHPQMSVRDLIERLAEQEAGLRETTFTAPWTRGLPVRVHIEGLARTFRAGPGARPGWGRFRALDAATAAFVGEASRAEVDAYLAVCRPARLCLAVRVRGQTWKAVQAAQPGGGSGNVTVLVHLVDRARRFDGVVGRFDGAQWWFQGLDRRSDPRVAEHLRRADRAAVAPEALRVAGLSPAHRAAYGLARQRVRRADPTLHRLRRALGISGSVLESYREQGDALVVDWRTPDGERHTAAVAREDLSVLDAGICLDGRDRDFDLAALVGVVRARPNWM